MPFKSAKQKVFLRMNHPEIYKRWMKEEKSGHYKSKLRKPKK